LIETLSSFKNSPTLPCLKNHDYEPSMVVHTFNPSYQEAEARGSQVQGQPELHSKTLSQKIIMTMEKILSLHIILLKY
jgi:hypothetical protein